MATPMITNWKKTDASRDKEVDPTLYRQLIGSLMYLVNTRSDLCYAINTLSQFIMEPKRVHWVAAKHSVRYVRGTVNFGLRYTKGNDIELSGFTDADWAGSSVARKSTTRYCFDIGSGMTSWCNKKQKSVALSFVEAECMAASKVICEAIWLRKLLVNLFTRRIKATRIFCDNQSCIKLSENPVFHDRSKHIDIWCHFIRDERYSWRTLSQEIKWQIYIPRLQEEQSLFNFGNKWVCWKIPFNRMMQHLRESCSTDAAVAVAVSWAAVQQKQQHNVGGSRSAERRCFRNRAASKKTLLLEHFPR